MYEFKLENIRANLAIHAQEEAHTMIRISSTVFAATVASGLLFAGTPVLITNNLKGTVGVAASTSQLLFTQPFCATPGLTRGVYSVNTTTGAASLYAAIPETGTCTENYIAL